MERGDVYLVSLDPAAGHEQQGKRPVLVISPGRFNRLTGGVFVGFAVAMAAARR